MSSSNLHTELNDPATVGQGNQIISSLSEDKANIREKLTELLSACLDWKMKRNLYYLSQSPPFPISLCLPPQSLIPMHWLEVASTVFPIPTTLSLTAPASLQRYPKHSAVPLHTDAESSSFE